MKTIDYTKAILHAIDSPKMKQQDIAAIYILLITFTKHSSIPAINEAIVDRWSVAGLINIKELAWNSIGNQA